MKNTTKKKLFTTAKVIFILLAASFVILFLLSKKGNGNISLNIFHEKEKEMLIDDFFDSSDYEKKLKSQKSDIAEMTNYDKFKMGLDTAKGADSDMDGLSDKEEIEKYGSDPTKTSTSGDMYSDGYKVAHDMDLTKEYEYKDDLDFPDNTCKAVNLEATSARDFNACVSDFTGSNMYNLSDKEVLKVYSVFCYSGYVTIDLSLIDKSLSADDVNVYVQDFYDTKAKVVRFTSDQKKITLSKAYDYENPYIIYLVKEKATLAKMFASVVVPNDVTFGSTLTDEGTPEYCYGIISCFGVAADVKIKYVDIKDDKAEEQVRDQLVSAANNMLSDSFLYECKLSDDDVIATSKEEVDDAIKKAELLSEIIPKSGKMKKNDDGTIDAKSYKAGYSYYVYDGAKNTDYASVSESNSSIVSNFNTNKDILPFPNFGTEYSPGGVCAGISHLTSSLHNNGKIDNASGGFKTGETVYSWDLTKDPENKTLLDRGLSDYKDSEFVKKHQDENGCVTKNLTDGEESFVNLVNYYLAKGNNAFSTNDYAKGIGGKDAGKDAWTMFFYDGTVIRNTIKELDKGNIVDAYFLLNDGSGHAVNLIGYEKAKTKLLGKITEGYVFYVYDSNYPNVIGTLTCEIHKHTNGTESLIYNLNIPGASYSAHSGGSLETKFGKVSLFVVLDSNFKVLND